MYDVMHMLRLQYFSNPERVRGSLKAHRELINALEKKDGELAEKIRKETLRSTYKSLIEMTP
jgi:DNA-binding GntR family transcriptional regulator